ncbi:GNAT family N-acetyltransferase [Salinibacillus xinjiangensis]|uniref:GNAT family N-acetyltransferase n=1 Tax=Salinibacillus xinjiangensis TaxID=1229268 RepID=A0A6G1X511_9BACI|nr:GNAT family N-acetyltransferase [Salinibacillus xinjiangensis]MRG85918.1 GNAT family N-acetyltransferase [Salinibacillus xinjiangensis]
MNIIAIREHSEYRERAIQYFQHKWANEDSKMVYDDCITNSLTTSNPLPQWYILMDGDKIIGCAGLITNDFISRMDLYPWICAVYVEEAYRGHSYGALLLDQAKEDALKGGFSSVYLCTDLEGYYEKYGFHYMADGFHPWGERSRIYESKLS